MFKLPCAIGPTPSGGIGVVTVAVDVVLALLQAFLMLLADFLELHNFTQKLHICIWGLFIWGCTLMLAPPETLFVSPVLLILATVGRIMGCVHVSMLLTQKINALHLGDSSWE